MAISKAVRDNIITAVVTAALTAGGFLGKEYIDQRNRQNQYVGELYKQLYDKEAQELEKFDSAYAEFHTLLSKNFALTTYEIEPSYSKLKDALASYGKYIKELERFGNSGQVQVAKNLEQWLVGLYAEADLQYKSAGLVEDRVRQLLQIRDTKGESFKSLNSALDADIERLVQNENRIYYETGWYQRPVINGLEQYLNYQFRSAIGLEATAEMAKAVNELPEISKRKPESEYKESDAPFAFAAQRAFYAPTLTVKDGSGLFKQKNELLKRQAKINFITQVVEHDSSLKALLKKQNPSPTKKG